MHEVIQSVRRRSFDDKLCVKSRVATVYRAATLFPSPAAINVTNMAVNEWHEYMTYETNELKL